MTKGARKSSFIIDLLYLSIILSKAGAIEFFASDKAFRIYNKSKWHEKAIEYLWKRLRK